MAKIGNTLRQYQVQLRDLAQRFTDDLELPLNRGMDDLTFGLGANIEPSNEPKDHIGSLLDVPKKGTDITLHKQPRAPG